MDEKLKNYIYINYRNHDNFNEIVDFYNSYIDKYIKGYIYGNNSKNVFFKDIIKDFHYTEYYLDDVRQKLSVLDEEYKKLDEEYKKLKNKYEGLIGENKNLNNKISNKDLKLDILFKNATEETKNYINELINLGLLK